MQIVVIIVLITFSGALFTLIPGGEILQKLTIIGLVFIMLAMRQQISLSRRGLVLIWPFLVYFVIAILSAFLHSYSIAYTLAAIHSLLFGLIVYVWVINLNIKVEKLRGFTRLMYVIVVIQFIFVLLKYFVHGIDEKVLIGTMSNTAGQLGFLFPAIVIPLLYFTTNRKNTLVTYALIAAMFLFGIINEKRAVIFLLPLIVFASIAINHIRSDYRIRHMWASMIVGGIIVISGVVIGLYTIPSLNPEETYGGNISLLHAYKYGIEYLTMDFGGSLQGSYKAAASDTGIQVGRVILWASIIDWLKSVDTWTLLLGKGFGTATPSIWLHEGSDILFNIIGTRGAICGAGLALIETGIVGFLTIGYWFIHIFLELISAHRQVSSLTARRWFRTLMIIHFVFCFDFFFYSTVLMRTLPMPFIFFALIASIALVKQWDRALLCNETAMQTY